MKLKPVYLVLAFLGLLCLALCHEARAEVSIEAGGVFMSSDYARGGALILSERFRGKYEVQVGYVSETFVNTCGRPDCAFDMRENLFVGFQRVTGWSRFKLGIGAAYFQHTGRALGCRFNASLLAEYRFTARLTLRARHFSNAGSCPNNVNLGLDYVGIAWGFGE